MLKVLRNISVRSAQLDALTTGVSLIMLMVSYLATVELMSPKFRGGECLTKDGIYIKIVKAEELDDVYIIQRQDTLEMYYSSMWAIESYWKVSLKEQCELKRN